MSGCCNVYFATGLPVTSLTTRMATAASTSLSKLDILADTVMAKCDVLDGIEDGVIDDPLSCGFDPDIDLAPLMCSAGRDGRALLHSGAVADRQGLLQRAVRQRGRLDHQGRAPGSGARLDAVHSARRQRELSRHAAGAARGHIENLFYEQDPGVPVADLTDLSRAPDRSANPPEYAWWEFDIDDVTAGRADFMKAITNADDPDLRRFHVEGDGKLILWHGWADAGAPPEPDAQLLRRSGRRNVRRRFARSQGHARLFMFPGHGSLRRGAARIAGMRSRRWLTGSRTARRRTTSSRAVRRTAASTTNGASAHIPRRASYTGPDGGQNDPQNWVQAEFLVPVNP